ncbi:MAG: thioredoxin [Bacteroidetes bacterium MED-G20]|nr:MAG: thioredoxin [Bacteroidetes bacterium MED-G20]|tara:strand:- start:1583 stop:1882 length:300 start_codon:yes stop_codon:yes gene_type:complete
MSTFQEIIKGEIPVLVDFYADWCAPCKTMNPILKKIKKNMGDNLKIIKINVDNNQQVASKFQVRGIPTFILFKNNEVKWRQSGIIDEIKFLETIKLKIN